MVAVATSPVLVGRSAELALLGEFWRGALDGVPKGVIVSGEAGLGKSRLLREFAHGLEPEPVVAIGYCDQLGALGIPFAPIREAMVALVDQFGQDVVRQRLGPGRLRDLASLVPELGADDEAPLRPGAVHTAVRDTLVLLSEVRPILLVLEDIHWADAATLDLLRAVVSRFSKGRVVISLTCRDDEVPADNALGQFLSEFDRLNGVQRVELARLTPGEVREQVAAIRGQEHQPDADQLARRSDGVPFLVEELVAVGDGPVPGSLRGVVLARYLQMSPPTRAVLREVAIGGGAVRHALLERVHDGEPQELAGSLGEAVAAHVLVVREDDYVFRHALTQEAVAGEVLPGERARLHQRYADELEQAGGEAAAIAHHRLALGDTERAFAALLRATSEAQAAGAVASAARFGEQVLELWDELPEATALAESSRARFALDVVAALIETGDAHALVLLDRELADIPDDDRRGRALLLHERSLLLQALGRADICDLTQQALDTLPEPVDDADLLAKVRLTCGVGSAHGIAGDPAVAGPALEWSAEQARELIRRSGPLRRRAETELIRVLARLTSFRVREGDVAGALGALAEAETLDRSPAGTTQIALGRVELLRALGRTRDCLDTALEALQAIDSQWLDRSWGGALMLHVMHRRLELGDLVGAERTVRSLRPLSPLPFVRASCRIVEWEILRLRDRADEAWSELGASPDAFAGIAGSVHGDLMLACSTATLALDVGEYSAVRREVSRLWEDPRILADSACFELAAVGAEALAADRAAGWPGIGPEDAAVRLRAVLARLSVWPHAGDWEALVEAHLSDDDPAAWARAVAAVRLGRVPVVHLAEALSGLGRALIGAGRRGDARDVLEEASAVAERIGDLRMLRRVAGLRQRAGPPEAPGAGTDGVGALTPRERQVLALIADGLTNRQIGRRLFITEKTASVHVSAILRKLGVASRTEAAVRAVAE